MRDEVRGDGPPQKTGISSHGCHVLPISMALWWFTISIARDGHSWGRPSQMTLFTLLEIANACCAIDRFLRDFVLVA